MSAENNQDQNISLTAFSLNQHSLMNNQILCRAYGCRHNTWLEDTGETGIDFYHFIQKHILNIQLINQISGDNKYHLTTRAILHYCRSPFIPSLRQTGNFEGRCNRYHKIAKKI